MHGRSMDLRDLGLGTKKTIFIIFQRDKVVEMEHASVVVRVRDGK